jgi:putative hydrolase of HD superfamily
MPDKIADFLFECAALKRVPRSGWDVIAARRETVAEHSWGTAVFALLLAREEGLGEHEAHLAVIGALFHDLHEARTSDLNMLNKGYAKADAKKAMRHQFAKIDATIAKEAGEAFANRKVAAIIEDADKLELIVSAKERLDEGNKYAKSFMDNWLPRLKTKSARRIAREVQKTDSRKWMFDAIFGKG